MSRIGRLPIAVPSGVDVKIDGLDVRVKGPKGELQFQFAPSVVITQEGNELIISRESEEQTARALHGTTRAVLSNMVTGVSTGFSRVLQIQGVGYRAEMNGQNLVLHVGYSHPVVFEPTDGISFETDKRGLTITVHGFDKQQVGQVAANIRKVRPVEPYKGKGIFYEGERIRRKAGKAGKK